MKRLNPKELRSLNECAYHTMSNQQLDESIFGAIGKLVTKGAAGAAKAGSVAARSTSAVGRSGLKRAATVRIGRARQGIQRLGQDIADKISDIRTGTTTASSTRAAQRAASAPGAAQRAVSARRVLKDRQATIRDALNASRNTPMSTSDAAKRISAEKALAAGKLDDAELVLGLKQPITATQATHAARAARGGSGLATAAAGAAGGAVGSSAGKKRGFLSKQFGEVEDAALAGVGENLFGDLKRTLELSGRATGSRINIQNRFRGLKY